MRNMKNMKKNIWINNIGKIELVKKYNVLYVYFIIYYA